jgi:endonuclease/exonuclease/phosphatase family metal-dependent hydrolase
MLKVLTLNINAYGVDYGLWEVRREMIRSVVEKSRPDIVVLQAARMEGQVHPHNQAQQLADRLSGYDNVRYSPAGAVDEEVVDGLAILSKTEISDIDILPLGHLPGTDDPNRRILLHALFQLKSGPLQLFNAHFSWVAEQLQQNVEEALLFAQGFHGPKLLMGDLNAEPDSPALDKLRRAGWVDAWQALEPGSSGYTFVENGALSKRIDYAWVSGGAEKALRSIEVVASKADEQGRRASDHAGLLVSLDYEV